MHLLPRSCCACARLCSALLSVSNAKSESDPRLDNAFRRNESGWIYVHLEGTASAIGFQHPSSLCSEIEDSKRAVELSTTHGVQHSWIEMRTVSRKLFVPKLPDDYRQELKGIVDGLHAHGSKLDFLRSGDDVCLVLRHLAECERQPMDRRRGLPAGVNARPAQ